MWQRRYGGDPSIVGNTVDVSDLGASWRNGAGDRKQYAVVGVAPRDFRGLSGQADVFIPITTRTADELGESQSHEFFMVARRKPGIGVAAAVTAVKLLGVRVRDAFNEQDSDGSHWGATARPLDDIRVSPIIRRALLVVFGAVACVLLIACVNVANLLLGRSSLRRREIAVRLALGGTRRRIVRLLLTESILLAVLGGVAGIAVAWIGARALSTVDPDVMASRGNDTLNGLGAVTFSGVHVDWTALTFSLAITLVVGIVFGLVPAMQATGASVSENMKAMSGDSDVRQRGARGRRMLVVVEVALAMILLAGSGLLIRSFGKLMTVDRGFRAEHVLTLRLTIPSGGEQQSMPAFYTELLDRLRALPGVVDASLNSCPPLGGGCFRTPIEFPDRARVDGAPRQGVRVSWATPTWFATVLTPLERGRFFASTDRAGAPNVALINEAAARAFWPSENPLGKRVGINGAQAQVIGIVGDVRQFIDSLAKPEVYLPYAQSPASQMMIFVRVGGDPVALAASARRAIAELAPQYPVYDIQPMTALVAGATAQARFSAVLLGLFAATALSLAVVGIYGVMALVVTARTREIGIRMALGADQHSVRRLVVSEGVTLVSVGVILGLAGALACTRVLQGLLFDLSPTDPVTYCAIVGLLGLATLAASWVPARRASSVDPVVALRAD